MTGDDAEQATNGESAPDGKGVHMTARRFRDISRLVQEGRESEVDKGDLAEYNRVKNDLARSASRMSPDAVNLPALAQSADAQQAIQSFMEESRRRSNESLQRSFDARLAADRAKWQREEAARQVSRDQLGAMKQVLNEVQAQRLEAAENAKSSSKLNWRVFIVSSVAALAGVVSVGVSIIGLSKG